MFASTIRTMDLPSYIAAVDGSEVAFAKRSGVSQSTVNRICRGRKEGHDGAALRLKTAYRIIRASHDRPAPGGGVVSLDDLYGADCAA